MHQIANGILHDYHMAEDAVQRTLIKLADTRIFPKLGSPESSSTKNYLLKSVKNISIDIQRNNFSNILYLSETNEYLASSKLSVSTIENFHKEILYHELLNIIKNIPTQYSDIFICKEISGMTTKEIAFKYNITECLVRKRLSRCRKMIIERLPFDPTY